MNGNLEDVLSKNPQYPNASKSTALETLVFEECNISFQGLEVLLKLPKALKNLTLGERMHHTSSIVPLGFRSKLLEALGPQGTSIKYLKHLGGGKYWSQAYLLPFFREDISQLRSLETIELGPALEGKYITQGLPSTLRKIRFLDTFEGDLDSNSSLFENPMWSSTFQNSGLLHQIDLVLYRGQSYDLWSNEERREEVNKITTKLRKQNTELAIYTPKPCQRSLIPPYMYGEELPEEVLSYVSSSPNTFGNKFYELDKESANADDETSSTTAPVAGGDDEDGNDEGILVN
jgi:hypothetical protein